MSIWGGAPDANDDAADWLADLRDDPSMAALRDAFDAVGAEDAGAYLEVTEAACAVMAAAVLADLLEPRQPDAVDMDARTALKDDFDRLTEEQRKKLISAAARSLLFASDATRSELAQLMGEDERLAAEWARHLDEVAAILRAHR